MLTIEQASLESGIPRRTLQYHAKKGTIESQKIGRDWVIESSELQRFMKEKPKPGPITKNNASKRT